MTHADGVRGRPRGRPSIHSAGYLSVSAVIALVVFEKLGVGLLRKAWINLDLVWAIALVVTSVATLAMA